LAQVYLMAIRRLIGVDLQEIYPREAFDLDAARQ